MSVRNAASTLNERTGGGCGSICFTVMQIQCMARLMVSCARKMGLGPYINTVLVYQERSVTGMQDCSQ